MAIRFQCVSCSQPIEVDDEWATKTIACPFCHQTMTAPAASTLGNLSEVPLASPVPDEPVSGGPVFPGAAASRGAHPNRIAQVALLLACGSVALMIMCHLVLRPHALELQELQQALEEAGSFTESMDAQTKFLETYPDAQRWLVAASMLAIASGLAVVASLICGLIGVRRPQRRGMALAALCVAGLSPVFFCCGGLLVGG